jgi:hypothetical protein
VPSIHLEKNKPNLNSNCSLNVENIILRGGGFNQSLQWGHGSPSYCSVLTTSTTGASAAAVITTTSNATATKSTPSINKSSNVQAMNDLIDRLFSSVNTNNHSFDSPFVFNINNRSCNGSRSTIKPPCYSISTNNNEITINGTSISEIGAGVGYYLRNVANMTIGWKRGGGNNIFIPSSWPAVDTVIANRRNTQYSYIMNVCTHSYSLVWYSWEDWSFFLDWMSLSGINLYLAMTGQEEVQYKVFQKFGLTDMDIRKWFNGKMHMFIVTANFFYWDCIL